MDLSKLIFFPLTITFNQKLPIDLSRSIRPYFQFHQIGTINICMSNPPHPENKFLRGQLINIEKKSLLWIRWAHL